MSVSEFLISQESDVLSEWQAPVRELAIEALNMKAEDLRYIVSDGYLVENVLIARSGSARHVKAIVDALYRAAKGVASDSGSLGSAGVDGRRSDWSVIDVPGADLLVHVATYDYMEKYRILDFLYEPRDVEADFSV